MTTNAWICVAGMNLIGFFIFAVDKKNAVFGGSRIPQSLMMLVALFGGAFGAWLGAKCFRYESKRPKIFQISLWVFMILQAALWIYAAFFY